MTKAEVGDASTGPGSPRTAGATAARGQAWASPAPRPQEEQPCNAVTSDVSLRPGDAGLPLS